MRVVQLSSRHCPQCEMMKRVLGDRAEYAYAEERPDLVEMTAYTTLPVYLIFDSEDLCVGAFSGMMPLSAWKAKVAQYRG